MKQYDIATMVGLRGVCFQVTPDTSAAFQMVFFENGGKMWSDGSTDLDTRRGEPFLFIDENGSMLNGYNPHDGYEQVILAPEKFNNQKELMEFLVMGGEIRLYLEGGGYEVGDFESDGNISHTIWGLSHYGFENWKPRIDKPKPKWFLAYVTNTSAFTRFKVSQVISLGDDKGYQDNNGETWKIAMPLTDLELSEIFGLKRIENDA